MTPLWRSRLHSGNMALFFMAGIFSMAIFAPLGRIIHVVGHGIFASATSCSWIGIHTPLFSHGQALLNYPRASYGGTFISLWYWNGGFLFLSVIMVLLYAFPFPPGFVPQMLTRLASLHILLTGGFLPLIETLERDDILFTADLLKYPIWIVFLFYAVILAVIFAISLFLLIRLPGSSLSMGGGHRFLFTLVIWTLPLALYGVCGYYLARMRGAPLVTVAILGLFPLLLAPFLSSNFTIFPRPKWGRTILILFLLAVLLNGLLYFTMGCQGSDSRAILWKQPTKTHNIPTSLMLWRWYP